VVYRINAVNVVRPENLRRCIAGARSVSGLAQHPPKAVFAAASDAGDESSANVLPAQLNQITAAIRVYVLPSADAASRIHCDFETPAGSLGVASALAHSPSIIGLVALSDATRE
jgi:hypothetical protein